MSIYLLDSDHLSLHQRGHEPLKMHLLETPPEQIYIPIISVEELVRGRQDVEKIPALEIEDWSIPLDFSSVTSE